MEVYYILESAMPYYTKHYVFFAKETIPNTTYVSAIPDCTKLYGNQALPSNFKVSVFVCVPTPDKPYCASQIIMLPEVVVSSSGD